MEEKKPTEEKKPPENIREKLKKAWKGFLASLRTPKGKWTKKAKTLLGTGIAVLAIAGLTVGLCLGLNGGNGSNGGGGSSSGISTGDSSTGDSSTGGSSAGGSSTGGSSTGDSSTGGSSAGGSSTGDSSTGGSSTGGSSTGGDSVHTHTAGVATKQNEVAATCIKNGSYDLVVTCTECHKELSRETKILSKLGHGYRNGTCTRCGAKDPDYYPTPSEGLMYSFNDDGKSCALVDIGFCKDKNIVISATYKGLPVTSIEGAFYNYSNLTNVVIPDSVTSIGRYAFQGCSNLTNVVIPDSVTSIGEYAFESCSSLTSIVIPDSVTSIGGWAFWNCSSLTDVYYTGSEAEWKAIPIEPSTNAPLTNATIHYNYVKE